MNENCPLAYKEGSQDFYGRTFKVTPDTLIPRAETEMAVDAILNLAGKSYLPGVKPSASKIADDLTILDVGTGSGCIAITIKLALPSATVYASDISAAALAVAKTNANKLNADVNFLQSDLLKNIDLTPDLIVANLPYVNPNWSWLNKQQLSYEPALALYAEDGGLALIKQLIATVPSSTRFLILEADPCEHASIIDYAKAHHFTLYETRGFILVFQKNPAKNS